MSAECNRQFVYASLTQTQYIITVMQLNAMPYECKFEKYNCYHCPRYSLAVIVTTFGDILLGPGVTPTNL